MVETRLLLVEGSDDRAVCTHFINRHGITTPIDIKDSGGFENLLKALPVRLKASSPRNLGVVVDADCDVVGRWQQLRSVLVNAGVRNIPEHPPAEGLVTLGGSGLRIGVWIMPDNTVSGEIEHFVSSLVPENDSLWPYAERCVYGIPSADRRFKESDLTRSVLHTWLAWQEEPGTPMGLAITRRYLTTDGPVAQRFLAWLQYLFLDSEAEDEAAVGSEL